MSPMNLRLSAAIVVCCLATSACDSGPSAEEQAAQRAAERTKARAQACQELHSAEARGEVPVVTLAPDNPCED
ncbi:MAG: hypothetical protein R3E84_21395 [Pseudomonadales bacterium]